METLTLARYEAQGNDFLIALLTELDLGNLDTALDAHGLTRSDLARVACDRSVGFGSRRGYLHLRGADGLVIGMHNASGELRTDSIRMHLLNADGSFAETSGNGLASLALAAFDAGIVADGLVRFETDAGTQHCDIHTDAISSKTRPGVTGRFIHVSMRPVGDGPTIPRELAVRIRSDLGGGLLRFGTGDVGNPHLVIALADPIDAARTVALGSYYETHFPSGINVEFVWPHDQRATGASRSLMMSVWERGAGLTHSCGSGSVVAATLARRWGLVSDEDSVRMETVPANYESRAEYVGERSDARAPDGPTFEYRVWTNPPPRLRVMAERIETGIDTHLGDINGLLADHADHFS